MRLLLLGASGQVGWELRRSLQPLGEVVAVDRLRADLSRPALLPEFVDRIAPDVVVNAGAYTDVDRAEHESALAFTINAHAPGALAEAARRAGALFVHYSTDYVFDGTHASPRGERAPTAPLNCYGRSKLAGEQAVASAGGDWLVLRTSWIYAARGRNFLRTILRLGAERERFEVVADQVGAPTSARLVADATAQIVAKAGLERDEDRFRPELLHLCAAGETSRHAFAQAIVAGWRARAGDDALVVREVVPVASSAHPAAAVRPLDARLDCSRIRERYALHLPHWEEGMNLVLDELATEAAVPGGVISPRVSAPPPRR